MVLVMQIQTTFAHILSAFFSPTYRFWIFLDMNLPRKSDVFILLSEKLLENKLGDFLSIEQESILQLSVIPSFCHSVNLSEL